MRAILNRLLMLGLLLACLGWPAAGRAAAQAGLQVQALPAPDYTFGQVVTFRLSATSDAAIHQVTFYYRAGPAAAPVSAPGRFTPGREVAAFCSLDQNTTPLSPFAHVDYWWVVGDDAGREVTTPPQTFRYLDNRFAWQALSQAPVSVHWYQGDLAFGQSALSIAASGLAQASRSLQVLPPQGIDIYIYADLTAAQPALQPANRLWLEGRADPALNLVIATVSPDADPVQSLERQLPHELMHLMIYRLTGEYYGHVPNWLNEGLAVMNQARPDPQSAQVLAAARQAGRLPSLASLCGPFPADAAEARLAYAESEAVVRYLYQQYGAPGVARLLAAYVGEADCAAGVQRGLNLPLADLDRAWRQSLADDDLAAALWVPWAGLAGLILVAGSLLALLAATSRGSQTEG